MVPPLTLFSPFYGSSFVLVGFAEGSAFSREEVEESTVKEREGEEKGEASEEATKDVIKSQCLHFDCFCVGPNEEQIQIRLRRYNHY